MYAVFYMRIAGVNAHDMQTRPGISMPTLNCISSERAAAQGRNSN
jgi:hypothetical protein